MDDIARRQALTAALGVVALAAATTSAEAAPPALDVASRDMLTAYAGKDIGALLAMFDPEIVVVGTDVAEHAIGPTEARRVIEADYGLWDTSEFGPFNWIHFRTVGRAGWAIFQTRWTRRIAGTENTYIIRFSTAWRQQGNRWLLTQVMNQVATEGQSASEIQQRIRQGPHPAN